MIPADRARRILHLALPIVGGMVSQNLLNLIDTAMVGSVGTAALAGVGLGSFGFFMSFAVLIGLASAVQAVTARRVGEGNEAKAATPVHEGILVSLVAGVPLGLMLWFASPTLFGVLAEDPAVYEHALPYYRARLFSIVAVGVNVSFRGFWNGVNLPALYFRTLVTMHVVNVVVSYALIFGIGGLPELGSLGAGVGSAVATWVGVATYFMLAMGRGRPFGFALASSKPSWASAMSLFRLAIPNAAQQFLFAAGFTVYFWILGRIGTAELAAGNVIINLTLVAILPGLGLGFAAASLVGQALGRGNAADAKQWGWDVTKVGVVVLALLGLPMVAFPDAILSIFLSSDPDAMALARLPLQIVGATTALEAVGLVLQHSLLGAGAARSVAMVSVFFQWGLFLPMAYVVGPIWGMGLLGVAMWQAVTRVLQAVSFGLLWRSESWMGISV